MASVNDHAIAKVPYSHTGIGDAGRIAPSITYRAGCTHIPTIDFGSGNVSIKALSVDMDESVIIAAVDASISVCDWAIKELNMTSNGVTALDVSELRQILFLYLGSNVNLTEIDVSNNVALRYLHIQYSAVSQLDLSNNPNLYSLYAYNTSIQGIDVSMLPELVYLYSQNCGIGSIDISSNTKLKYVYLQSTQITSIDVSNNPLLRRMYLYNNDLSTLNITQNTELTHLLMSGNNLQGIDLTGQSDLVALDVTNNDMSQTNLDLSLSQLDAAQPGGGSGKTINIQGQSTGAGIDTGSPAAVSAQSLADKGWTFTYDGTYVFS